MLVETPCENQLKVFTGIEQKLSNKEIVNNPNIVEKNINFEFSKYLVYSKPSFSFSENTTSSDRMNKLKNKTKYTNFKKNSTYPININSCNLPLKYLSYQNKLDITRGNVLCNNLLF